jgi:hypothetical protein
MPYFSFHTIIILMFILLTVDIHGNEHALLPKLRPSHVMLL